MVYSPPLPPSRIHAGFGVFRGVRGFLVKSGSSAYAACASSSVFRSAALLRSVPIVAVGSNPAVKPIRLRRPAYFGC